MAHVVLVIQLTGGLEEIKEIATAGVQAIVNVCDETAHDDVQWDYRLDQTIPAGGVIAQDAKPQPIATLPIGRTHKGA